MNAINTRELELEPISLDLAGKNEVVYVLKMEGTSFYKIGYTSNLAGRIRSLQTASPTRLTLAALFLGGTVIERKLHGKFASYRCQGEWFEIRDPRMIETLMIPARPQLPEELIALKFFVYRITGLRTDVYSMYSGTGSSAMYQIMPEEMDLDEELFDYLFRDGEDQYFPSPLEAAAVFVSRFDEWEKSRSCNPVITI